MRWAWEGGSAAADLQVQLQLVQRQARRGSSLGVVIALVKDCEKGVFNYTVRASCPNRCLSPRLPLCPLQLQNPNYGEWLDVYLTITGPLPGKPGGLLGEPRKDGGTGSSVASLCWHRASRQAAVQHSARHPDGAVMRPHPPATHPRAGSTYKTPAAPAGSVQAAVSAQARVGETAALVFGP